MRDPLAAFFDLEVMKPFIFADDPEIAAEIEGLKNKLKFRSWSQDSDALLHNLELKVYNQDGCTPYAIATYIMTEAYYTRKAWEPLASAYRGFCWPVPEWVNVFVEHASADGRSDLVEKIWRNVAEKTKLQFLESYAERQAYPNLEDVRNGSEQAKINALAAYDNLAAFYRATEIEDRLAETVAAREMLKREAFRKPLAESLHLKIDEVAFWGLLQDVHANSASDELDPTALLVRLEEFSGPSIRKFYSLYAKNMKRLYHWNVWALAYAARGGCSDDAFHDFRVALITKGNPDLVDLAIEHPEEAARYLIKGENMAEWSMYSTCLAAYLARTGQVLKDISTDLSEPRGLEWDEHEFEKSYPKLLAVFA